MFVVFGACAALARPPLDEGAIAVATAEIVPQVEAIAGRPFIAPPEVRLVSRAAFDSVWPKHRPFVLLRPGTPQPEPPAQNRRWGRERAPGAAVTFSTTGLVVLIEEQMEAFLDPWPADRRDAFLRCTIAHELVHVLQAQHTAPGRKSTRSVEAAARSSRKGTRPGSAWRCAGRSRGTPWRCGRIS